MLSKGRTAFRATVAMAAAAAGVAASSGPTVLFASAAVAVVSAAVLLVPSALLLGLVSARAWTDVGVAHAHPVLPSGALNAAIAAILVLFCAVGLPRDLIERRMGAVLITVLCLGAWGALAVFNFNSFSGTFAEVLRLLSMLATFVLASKYTARLAPWALTRYLLTAASPAAVLVLAGPILDVRSLLSPTDMRAVGSFSHANTAAAFLAITTVLSFWLLLSSHSYRYSVLVILHGSALLVTQSLGAIAACSCGCVVVLLLSRNIQLSRRLLIMLAAASMGVVLALLSGAGERLSELDNTQSYGTAAAGSTTNSLDWRFYNWSLLLHVWENRWLFGYGLGTTSGSIQPARNLPHSVPVQILVETGAVGLALCTIALFRILRVLSRRSSAGDSFAVAALGVTLTAVVHATESNMLNYVAPMYVLATILGRAYAFKWNAEQGSGGIDEAQSGRRHLAGTDHRSPGGSYEPSSRRS